jgi:DNA mismatch repair protein PMS2
MGEKVAREVQFFSMNGRPVDLPKISKVILDTWKIYDCLGNGIADDSIRKRPACILGLYLPSYMIDVNVSPDKREVFIVDDENLNTAIKEALSRLWSGQRGGFQDE